RLWVHDSFAGSNVVGVSGRASSGSRECIARLSYSPCDRMFLAGSTVSNCRTGLGAGKRIATNLLERRKSSNRPTGTLRHCLVSDALRPISHPSFDCTVLVTGAPVVVIVRNVVEVNDLLILPNAPSGQSS